MRVHVIGAGPTGMSVAWEILRSTDHEVTIYDRKESAGGSGGNHPGVKEIYTRIELCLIMHS